MTQARALVPGVKQDLPGNHFDQASDSNGRCSSQAASDQHYLLLCLPKVKICEWLCGDIKAGIHALCPCSAHFRSQLYLPTYLSVPLYISFSAALILVEHFYHQQSQSWHRLRQNLWRRSSSRRLLPTSRAKRYEYIYSDLRTTANRALQDPYFETIPATRLGGMYKTSKKRRRALPPGLTPEEEKILTKAKRRAYRVDLSLGSFLGTRFGWGAVIGLIPA